MTTGVLTADQETLLKEERRFLTSLESNLAVWDVEAEHRQTLAASVSQLDELFLVVVVGEFNAGKSAFINALLGEKVAAEGVTPTTAEIVLVRHQDHPTRDTSQPWSIITTSSDLLRHTDLVDTPGTNALDRSHEALTTEFVPRSDLVLFLTSADRPFSESERTFLEHIRQWGKKVIFVINKVDILASAADVEEVTSYVTNHARQALGVEPTVLTMSARQAADARASGDAEALRASGMLTVEEKLRSTLQAGERVALKLGNPLGVAERLLNTLLAGAEELFGMLHDDLQTVDDIDRQLLVWTKEVGRELDHRLIEIDNVLLRLERRGVAFFDDTVRLKKLFQLLDKNRIRAQFEREVVADSSQEIDQKVEDLIDWLVQSGLDQWQAVLDHVNRRRHHHNDRLVGDIGGRFDLDRTGLLDTIGSAARTEVDRYDRQHEARQLADDIQNAVAGTAVAEVGAIGLGATIAFLATSTAVDVTGLAAASLVAAVGLFILPNRRRQGKKDLARKIGDLRHHLSMTLKDQVSSAAERGVTRVRETISPYTRFVTAERDRLLERKSAIESLSHQVTSLSNRVQTLRSEETST